MHHATDLITIFNGLFAEKENTQLARGDGEPIYLPATEGDSACHQVVFAHGFFASALHEIAHWCIAGKQRRELVDYGYWYEPDGRCVEKQHEFALVEARPQAVEWVLHQACGHRFNISLDNLSLDPQAFAPFKDAVLEQITNLKLHGLPPRAAILQEALADFYEQPANWCQYPFDVSQL
ncbi:Elongation factor P hydroxylase [BD1-7 clade bacterium]|uniref:Elongation factor P hydroxylase n=1 Tax=BD1-7 clade bacterium TaxID=2029982 RepID=A0A5S9QHN1_9GAMM|nr:Elongation factor P hydroxylase [BD1-7 clade bacterium]CAA0117584.1 Elongation factor P hydroxylase [BD1-7 clade bacterium]